MSRQANKQLEKLEVKLKTRQAAVDSLGLTTPRGGHGASPRGPFAGPSPRLTPLSVPSPRVSYGSIGAASVGPSPRGATPWGSGHYRSSRRSKRTCGPPIASTVL